MNVEHLEVQIDSQLVVNHVSIEYIKKKEKYIETYLQKVKDMIKYIRTISLF